MALFRALAAVAAKAGQEWQAGFPALALQSVSRQAKVRPLESKTAPRADGRATAGRAEAAPDALLPVSSGSGGNRRAHPGVQLVCAWATQLVFDSAAGPAALAERRVACGVRLFPLAYLL